VVPRPYHGSVTFEYGGWPVAKAGWIESGERRGDGVECMDRIHRGRLA